jgi:structural maintenance of chromosome 4
LIKISDPKYADAFYFGVRDTLVCEGIDVATKIGYGPQKRFRVVTINGELIEMSGTMSGGGKKKYGGMGNRVVEEYSEEVI